jgi:hypothetical protein
MADHVLAHLLLERKAPLLMVEFPVFWEHFDLKPGDTIEIENPLFGGRKFFIEEIKRTDPFRAIVRAVEWWGRGVESTVAWVPARPRTFGAGIAGAERPPRANERPYHELLAA